MGASHYRYPVLLTEEQRRWLETMVHTSSTPTKHYLVARVLLMSDKSQSEPRATDEQIAQALQISRRTVIRIKKRFVLENMQVALTGSFPRERPERRCLDGKGECTLTHKMAKIGAICFTRQTAQYPSQTKFELRRTTKKGFSWPGRAIMPRSPLSSLLQ